MHKISNLPPPPGTYTASEGQVECVECGKKQRTLTVGSPSIESCVCEAGGRGFGVFFFMSI